VDSSICSDAPRRAASRHCAAKRTLDEKTLSEHELLTAINGKHDRLFFGDCMASVSRSRGFLADTKFMAAFTGNAQQSTEENGRAWRVHTLAWAARHAMRLDGDFVEFEGFMSATLCEYLDFASSGKTFYLYDTFDGFSPKYSSPADFGVHHGFFNFGAGPVPGLYESVFERSRDYPNVKVIRGVVPDCLLQDMPGRIAYCHIDLNSPAAEVGALEVLFDRIVPGGVVMFDDYGWLPFARQKEAEDAFAERRGYTILELPTEQGLLITR
jgi:O-methyltransferase